MSDILQVFEHQNVSVLSKENLYENEKRVGISEDEYKALLRYHGKISDKFFTPSFRKIKFKHYVGVLQIGRLTIEILPKVDRYDDKPKWRDALYSIIHFTQSYRAVDSGEAKLLLKRGHLSDYYLFLFLKEVEDLIHRGVLKKYRQTIENLNNVKGRIVFNRDVFINHSNKAKAVCEYQVYDQDHLLNKVLVKALQIVQNSTFNLELKQKAGHLLMYFPKVGALHEKSINFSKIQFNRASSHYRPATNLAGLIINNFCPDTRNGQNHIVSFLFDMNHLYEQYVYKVLKRGLDPEKYEVHRRGKEFWNKKRIFPDIVVRNKKTNNIVILDTKWKVPRDFLPADTDLKQIFVYNEYYQINEAKVKGALLYPKSVNVEAIHWEYVNKNHSCSLIGLEVLDDENKLSPLKLKEFLYNYISVWD